MKYTPEAGFPYYFDLVKQTSSQSLFSSTAVITLLNSISEEKATHRYSPGKWSIKQVVGHITDHERIKISRAFLMSRNESLELWGYDQNSLVDNSRFDELTMKELVTDLANVRAASLSFIKGLSENQLQIKGMARQHKVTLEDFLKSMIGHETHHINIIQERYL